MHTLGTHFEELLKNIRPPQERLDAARDLPPKVRDYLEEHDEFETVDPHTRLTGSYAQHLCVGDVKDVDVLVRVDGDPDENKPEAKDLVRDLRVVLDGLPAALGYTGYAEAQLEIERARRSVHVYFQDHDFHLDVVPCIAPEGFAQPLYVPDRGFNKWIASDPLGYVRLIGELDGEHGDKVRPLAKLLKHFRNYQMVTRKPKSYWLGALLVHHIREANVDTTQPLAVLFRDLLKAVYSQYAGLLGYDDGRTPNIPDPMLGHNISWNWSRSHFETFMRRVKEGRDKATEALSTDDRAEAVSLWQEVFGKSYFPTDVSEAALEQAAGAWPGGAFVSGTGLVMPTRPTDRPATLTRATTFHGVEDA